MDYNALCGFIRDNFADRIEIMPDADMKRFTTFRIGGKADLALFPSDRDSLVSLLRYVTENNIKYAVIGNGSNVLFSDEGYRGVVIITTQMKNYCFGEDLLVCDAGAPLTQIAVNAVRSGYEGYAFACGIPGSIGGAVFMNAGAYEGQISDILVYSEYYDLKTGEICRMNADEHEFDYRHSSYMGSDKIILSAAFKLEKAKDPESVIALMNEHIKARRDKQPLEYPSAGSVFKRYPGYFTAKLIDQAGLKGFCVGGAQVSEKHAGFIVNKGDATAKDVCELIDIIKKAIFEREGINIECEVRKID
ncbi:MAG: UDP-N-acetylmuramate dehydrogenase [Ruminococcaceae bacterium]|nr:UDP-N-acetylmuramate dehydrogenase [Oscillospiraceae bacterium]